MTFRGGKMVLHLENEIPQLIADGKVRWTGDNSVSSRTATGDDVALLG